MSGILVFCRSCGKQVPSSSTRAGLCLDCQLSRAVTPLREEHARLWRKRERYRSGGANLDSITRQLGRIELRMAEKIRELVPSEKAAAEYLKKELEAARQSRYEIGRP
jgi:NMD protein affecting ribosome stability and mRNA decay